MPRLNINIDRLTEQGGSTTENLAGDSPLPPQELREVEPSSTSGGQKSFKERLLSAGFQRGREGDPFLFKVKGDTVRTFDTRSGDFAEMKLSTLAERDPDFVKNVLGVDVAPTRPTPDPTTPVDELIRAPDVDTSQPLNTSRQGSLENSVFAEKEEGRSLRQFRDVQEAAERVLNRRDEQRSDSLSRRPVTGGVTVTGERGSGLPNVPPITGNEGTNTRLRQGSTANERGIIETLKSFLGFNAGEGDMSGGQRRSLRFGRGNLHGFDNPNQ